MLVVEKKFPVVYSLLDGKVTEIHSEWVRLEELAAMVGMPPRKVFKAFRLLAHISQIAGKVPVLHWATEDGFCCDLGMQDGHPDPEAHQFNGLYVPSSWVHKVLEAVKYEVTKLKIVEMKVDGEHENTGVGYQRWIPPGVARVLDSTVDSGSTNCRFVMAYTGSRGQTPLSPDRSHFMRKGTSYQVLRNNKEV